MSLNTGAPSILLRISSAQYQAFFSILFFSFSSYSDTVNSCVINTYKLLSSRFSQSSVAIEERSRKMRRKKEQRKKVKRQKQRGQKQAYKLVSRTHGKEIVDDVFKDDKPYEKKLSVKKLESIKLLPRFHVKAIKYLIDNNVMDDAEQAKRLLEKIEPWVLIRELPGINWLLTFDCF